MSQPIPEHAIGIIEMTVRHTLRRWHGEDLGPTMIQADGVWRMRDGSLLPLNATEPGSPFMQPPRMPECVAGVWMTPEVVAIKWAIKEPVEISDEELAAMRTTGAVLKRLHEGAPCRWATMARDLGNLLNSLAKSIGKPAILAQPLKPTR